MAENSDFSNDNGQDLDRGLADIERAMLRFETILKRHSRATRRQPRRKGGTKSIINNSLTRILNIFTGQNVSGRSVLGAHAPKSNRYPASQGQFMADLAGLLQKIGSRNL